MKGPTDTYLDSLLAQLLPLLRRFPEGEYGIALGGAHAKGVADPQSDLDLYVFARQILPDSTRTQLLLEQLGAEADRPISWGNGGPFVHAGTDFYYKGQKIECWLRNSDYVAQVIADCRAGIVKHDFVTWTVMGFFNYCTLSDLSRMAPLEDPAGMLAGWKSQVSVYPPRLREAIVRGYLAAARFWPGNFHYLTAIERDDRLYAAGIVQQVVGNLVQVVFALNQVYFPGEKKLREALDHLALKPDRFTERVEWLAHPGVPASRDLLREQHEELRRLVDEVGSLTAAAG